MGGLFGKPKPQTKPEKRVSISNVVRSNTQSSYQASERKVEQVSYARVTRQIPPKSTNSTYNGWSYPSKSVETTSKSSNPLAVQQSSSYSGQTTSSYTRPKTEAIKLTYTPTSVPARTDTRSYGTYESSKVNEYKQPAAQVSTSSKKSESTVKAPDFVPYEGCLGRWVPANQFLGKGSSFGFYKCESCYKTWMSARSKKEFKQACKACNQYYFPAYLWQNDSKNYEKKEKALVDNLKNHLSDLCEACQKGSCTVNRTKGFTSSDYTVSRTMNYEREEYGYYDYDD